MKSTLASCVLLAAASGVAAWGPMGHETVGYIAMEFLAPNALAFVKETISASNNHSLGPVASWPDTVRKTPEYRWSAEWHFVDAEDSPANQSCSVIPNRDCPAHGCILTAIQNYTSRVVDSSLPAQQREEALKFITHFFGDISQPLHTEALALGGNAIKAVCRGQQTNLHKAWDDGLLLTYANATGVATSVQYAALLVNEIRDGAYAALAGQWLACASPKQTMDEDAHDALEDERGAQAPMRGGVGRMEAGLACPLVWAREANAYVCSNVFNYTPGADLCVGEYYEQAIPIIHTQIAKQGYRLAAWLNVLFDGKAFLP